MTLSVLVLIGLIVFSSAPLVVGILAARSNARFGRGATNESLFWGMLGGYLVVLGLVGWALISTVSKHQQEGYEQLFTVAFLTLLGLPGSILPFFTALSVDQGSIPRPIGISSMSVWLVIGTLSWQLLVVVGGRWLIQIRARRRSSELKESMGQAQTGVPEVR